MLKQIKGVAPRMFAAKIIEGRDLVVTSRHPWAEPRSTKPPPTHRQNVPIKSYRGKGACRKVVIVGTRTLVPLRSRGAKTVEDIAKEHGKDVASTSTTRWTSPTPSPLLAAEAAGMQGKFFEMHDKMFGLHFPDPG